MSNIEFANPEFLYLLLLLIPVIGWYVGKQSSLGATMQISDLQVAKKSGVSIKLYLRHMPFVLRCLALTLLIIVIARPQSTNKWQKDIRKGLDIVLTLDISTSMRAADFNPSRLEAAKNVAIEFISGRENDRIGLVVFAGETFTQCPITIDHAVLINLFKEIKAGMLEDGTAIGMGLANAVNRLKNSEAKSKVIILLTDGVNNKGSIAPKTAAEIAKTYGIRVYTIGVGTHGKAPYPFKTQFGVQYQQVEVEIDEEILRDIAHLTGGKYFRATNKQKLVNIYKEIDKLEKTKLQEKKFKEKNEEYLKFALAAGILLLLEFILRKTILKTIP
jgi:Ca-activated chloride channel family protein